MAPLATVGVKAALSGMPGRSIATSRSHHFIVDSPPPLGGPNEEINPLEVLLAALATCAVFICEIVAKEKSIPLKSATATAEGDFDPRGVKGEDVNPKVQAFRVKLQLTGPNEDQAKVLTAAFKKRCPIYTTLVEAAPIDLNAELVRGDYPD